jgi:hypothetical protein
MRWEDGRVERWNQAEIPFPLLVGQCLGSWGAPYIGSWGSWHWSQAAVWWPCQSYCMRFPEHQLRTLLLVQQPTEEPAGLNGASNCPWPEFSPVKLMEVLLKWLNKAENSRAVWKGTAWCWCFLFACLRACVCMCLWDVCECVSVCVCACVCVCVHNMFRCFIGRQI